MEKKTTATTIAGILILVLIICVGATLSAFKVQKQKVEVKSISIVSADGILVTDKKGREIEELDVKSSSVGVRPATGDEDSVTGVPSTINDAVGTEGAYAVCFVKSDKDWCVKLSSCTLSSGESENLGNVRIAVLDETSESVKGSDIGLCLATSSSIKSDKLTIVVWLDADTTKSIASADIKIGLEVAYI